MLDTDDEDIKKIRWLSCK